MSYQVLARKWRPASFEELVGQNHVLKALVSALNNQRLHHAYLFSGTRGVGKTTIARIFARCLNCEQGVSSTPCGQCSTCQEITEGRFVDLIEIDAASRTKVEDTREILDNVQYAPVRGRYKIYLIDEVHMLSMHSFNALLKTLEEPPEHIKFLLATTDPQKLPVTILSRCLQFNLKNMPQEQIVTHLENILPKESVTFETKALWQIAKAADGSMRDALSLTDQAIAFCDQNITENSIATLLGTVNHQHLINIINALADNNAEQLLAAIQKLSEQAVDYNSALNDILSLLHKVTIVQLVPNSADNYPGDKETLLTLAQKITPADVQLFYQSGLIGRRDMALAPDDQTGFEMALLRMLAFRPSILKRRQTTDQQPDNDLSNQDNNPTSDLTTDKQPKTQNIATLLSAKSQPSLSTNENVEDPNSQPEHNLNHQAQETCDHQTTDDDRCIAPDKQPEMPDNHKEEPPAIQKINDTTAIENTHKKKTMPPWHQLLPELNLSGMTRALAAHSVLEHISEHQKCLVLDQNYDILQDDIHRLKIEQALSQYVKQQVSLTLKTGHLNHQETPVMIKQREAENKLQAAKENIINSPQIHLLIESFSARVIPQSIRPAS